MKRQLLKIAVLVTVVGSVAYLVGGNILCWIVGFVVAQIVLRVIISFFYTIITIAILAIALFGLLIS